MLVCVCGFTCGTVLAFDKHLDKFKDSEGAGDHGATAESQKIRGLQRKFKRLDRSKDSKLDYFEMSALLSKGNPSLTEREMRALFQDADKDGSGALDFEEFMAHIFSEAAGHGAVGSSTASPAVGPSSDAKGSAELPGKTEPEAAGRGACGSSTVSFAAPEVPAELPGEAEPEAEPAGHTAVQLGVRGGASVVGSVHTEASVYTEASMRPYHCKDDDDPLTQTCTLWDVVEVPSSRPESSSPSRTRPQAMPQGPVLLAVDHFPNAGSDNDRALQKAIERGSTSDVGGSHRGSKAASVVGICARPRALTEGAAPAPAAHLGVRQSVELQKPPEGCTPPSSPAAPSCTPQRLHSPVRLLIVRHARSANKARSSTTAASLDPDLSDLGYLQAEALGSRLRQDLERLEGGRLMVVSSPMRRCLHTIRPTAHWLSLSGKDDCVVMGACYEFGCAGTGFYGSSVQELAQEFPEFQPRCFGQTGRWDYRFGSKRETEVEVKVRAVQIGDWIWEAALELSGRGSPRADKVIVLCIHQTMADILCQLLVDGSCNGFAYGQLKYKLQNTAFTELILGTNCDAKFGLQNQHSHLNAVNQMQKQATEAAPRGERIARLRNLFRQYDKSGNGRLDFGEMACLLRKGNPSLTEQELWALFTGADRTRDGDIDFDEFVEYIFSSSSGF